MPQGYDPNVNEDPFNLNRFLEAQKPVYSLVLKELRSCRKRTHWMWFIFPQVKGLGNSPNSMYFAIKSKAEAQKYLEHPVLGRRLLECTEILLNMEGASIGDLLGSPDDLKLKSSMTLFAAGTNPDSIFDHVLKQFFQGTRDQRTLGGVGIIDPPR